MCEGNMSRNTRHTILRRDSTLCTCLLSLPSSGVTFAAVSLLPPKASLLSCRLQTVAFVYFIFLF